MKRITLALVAMLFSTLALADCDLTLNMDVTFDGAPMAKSSIIYSGLDAKEFAFVQSHGLKVTDTASKVQDKGGKYNLVLESFKTCDGKPQEAAGGFDVRGLTTKGMAKIMRQMNQEAVAMIQAADDDDTQKGQKAGHRAWGRKK